MRRDKLLETNNRKQVIISFVENLKILSIEKNNEELIWLGTNIHISRCQQQRWWHGTKKKMNCSLVSALSVNCKEKVLVWVEISENERERWGRHIRRVWKIADKGGGN